MGDTFRMKLGNIPANESIKITFKYVVPLYIREVDTSVERFSKLKEPQVSVFSMPAKIGDRYDPNPGRHFNLVKTIPSGIHEKAASSKLAAKMSFTADIYADGGILSVTSAHQKFDVSFVDEAKKHAKVSHFEGLFNI